MNIVLLEPEIPHNTGAIGRTCSVTGSGLHLIRPLGFSTDEKHLKRSGLDYWHTLGIICHNGYIDFLAFMRENHPGAKIWMATTKAASSYADAAYTMGDFIMFGKESAGIPEDILLKNLENCVRVPMAPGSRSLNLSVSAGIILYEGLRQNGFPGLNRLGKFSGGL
ncbi:MAG: tRNA (cytidine(34)-2'-O)-methyltransferase [Defluviitaleaceae bacterium]|nr:tRNA (cytidine(34)-2'-O)-methyltransferase [Defluviitaleaceae bacterium]MCL2836885.1 tRNA (cytidine(34)-2'-O)-methyltransferase [Defluviitaleaceae bacterium]